MNRWPYPRWIAHRGGGTLAPENTLAAFRLCSERRYRMAECDVKLSRDGVPFLLHDDTLERTTSGRGAAGEQAWRALSRLDAGSWHSPRYAGERLARLDQVARYCLEHALLLNIEIKPSPGREQETGSTVARTADRLWGGAEVPPLLSSFSADALLAARGVAPALPRALLQDEARPEWLRAAVVLECAAVVRQHTLWKAAGVKQAHAAGLRALAYTVNEPADAQRLVQIGIDGLITDRIDLFDPAT